MLKLKLNTKTQFKSKISSKKLGYKSKNTHRLNKFGRNVAPKKKLLKLKNFKNKFSTEKKYDVVIVGGGPGGYVAAIKAGQLGLKTACVEKRGALGGTCLNVGCIPSKALLNASHKYHDAKHNFEKYGIKVDGLSVDFNKMMDTKTNIVNGLTQGIEGLFKKNKVDYFVGEGSLKDASTVLVDGKDALSTKNIVIATGSEPSSIPNVVIDEKRVVSSTGALALPEIPKTMIVIGAGVIGLELGSVYQRLGTEVTVVEFQDTIIPGNDKKVQKVFQQSLKKQGFNFEMKTAVQGVTTKGDKVIVDVENKKGAKKQLEADYVLVATGRKPYTDNLGLENLGIETDRGVIKVDHKLQTNVPGVWAIGDCVPGPMLAHKAEEEGVAIAETLAGKVGHVNYDAIPGVIYTVPEIATVGKTEEQVKADKTPYNVGEFPFLANSRARANLETEGFVKIISHKETDQVLGAHIVGSQAGELLAELVQTIEYGGSSEDVARTCHSHPTLSEAVKEAAMATYDKPVHM